MYKFILFLSLILLISCSNKYDAQWHNDQMQIVQYLFEQQMEIKQESVNCINSLSYRHCNAINKNGFPIKYICFSRGLNNQRKYCTLN